MANKNQGALVAIDTGQILEEIAGGAFSAHIAVRLGVSKQSLQRHLKDLPDYREAMLSGQEARLQKIIGQFESVGMSPPPTRPTKAQCPSIEDYEVALDEYRSEREAWQASCTVKDFDLKRLEQLWKSESWRAERTFPQIWGAKANVFVSGSISLDEILAIADRSVVIDDQGGAGEKVSDAELVPAGSNTNSG